MTTILMIWYAISMGLGLVLGSFSGATVWRLRAQQLLQDKKHGETYDKSELKRLKPLLGTRIANDRSRCLHCKHELKWYDLIPLASWLSTKGKCRYCKQRIGNFEPIIELGTAALFVMFFHYWVSTYGENGWLGLAVWAVMLTLFVILFAYDFKWFLLPDAIILPLIGLAVAYAGYFIVTAENSLVVGLSTVAAVIILSGLYLALWLVSKGQWVGFGDVKLGLALGLLLMDWKLALLALFLANFIGTLIVLPGLLTKKLHRQTHIPFGPLLIVGFFISLFWGNAIIDSYNMATIWLTNTLLML